MPNLESNQKPGFFAWWKQHWFKKETEERNETNRLNDQEVSRKEENRKQELRSQITVSSPHYKEVLQQKKFDKKEDFVYCSQIREWINIARRWIEQYAKKQVRLNYVINLYVDQNTKKLPDKIKQPPKPEERIQDLRGQIDDEYFKFAKDIWNYKIYLAEAKSKINDYREFETADLALYRVARTEGNVNEKIKNFQASLKKLEGSIFSNDVCSVDYNQAREDIGTWGRDAGLVPRKLLKSFWLISTILFAFIAEYFITSTNIQPIFGREAWSKILWYCGLFFLTSVLVAAFIAGTEKTEFLPSYKSYIKKGYSRENTKEICQGVIFTIVCILCYFIYCQQVNEINLAVFENIKAAGEVPPSIPNFWLGPFSPRLGETTAFIQVTSWVINFIMVPLSSVSIFNVMTMDQNWEFEDAFINLRMSYICEKLSSSFIQFRSTTFERHMQLLILNWYKKQAKSIDKESECTLHTLYSIKRDILGIWRKEFEDNIEPIAKECEYFSNELLRHYHTFETILTPPKKFIPRTYATQRLLNYIEVTDSGNTDVEEFLKQSYPTAEEQQGDNEVKDWIEELKKALAPEDIQAKIQSHTQMLPALRQGIMSEKNILSQIIPLIVNADMKDPSRDFLEGATKLNQAMGDRWRKTWESYQKPKPADINMLPSLFSKITEAFNEKNGFLEGNVNAIILRAQANLNAYSAHEFKEELDKCETAVGDSRDELKKRIISELETN
jgi:hypothetical protein